MASNLIFSPSGCSIKGVQVIIKSPSTDISTPPLSIPRGTLTNRTVAMPRDTNTHGDIFGGWLMSQMDLAGGVAAGRRARGRIVTVAVEEMVFHLPVKVGNVVSCYAAVTKVGRTSITVKIEVWAQQHDDLDESAKVTEGVFTYVALDKNRRPRVVPPTAN